MSFNAKERQIVRSPSPDTIIQNSHNNINIEVLLSDIDDNYIKIIYYITSINDINYNELLQLADSYLISINQLNSILFCYKLDKKHYDLLSRLDNMLCIKNLQPSIFYQSNTILLIKIYNLINLFIKIQYVSIQKRFQIISKIIYEFKIIQIILQSIRIDPILQYSIYYEIGFLNKLKLNTRCILNDIEDTTFESKTMLYNCITTLKQNKIINNNYYILSRIMMIEYNPLNYEKYLNYYIALLDETNNYIMQLVILYKIINIMVILDDFKKCINYINMVSDIYMLNQSSYDNFNKYTVIIFTLNIYLLFYKIIRKKSSKNSIPLLNICYEIFNNIKTNKYIGNISFMQTRYIHFILYYSLNINIIMNPEYLAIISTILLLNEHIIKYYNILNYKNLIKTKLLTDVQHQQISILNKQDPTLEQLLKKANSDINNTITKFQIMIRNNTNHIYKISNIFYELKKYYITICDTDAFKIIQNIIGLKKKHKIIQNRIINIKKKICKINTKLIELDIIIAKVTARSAANYAHQLIKKTNNIIKKYNKQHVKNNIESPTVCNLFGFTSNLCIRCFEDGTNIICPHITLCDKCNNISTSKIQCLACTRVRNTLVF